MSAISAIDSRADKKLIMISLQFVNNLIVQNERNKLVVWIELFDTAGDMKLSRGARPRDTSPGLWSRFNKLLSECQDISKKDGASSEENNGTRNRT